MATKKLIEVALPLEKINAESAREKSIRHGHPSTLHLWWARRPLVTARAVIWASLVDDPSSHPELFPTEQDQNRERQRLFKILEDLVVWENSNNSDVLTAARNEIVKTMDNNPPALLDPFAGGGAIPLEAQRLGLEAYAYDLNPVAVMINKAMIEVPSRFTGKVSVNPGCKQMTSTSSTGLHGIAEDIEYYGKRVKEKAYKQCGHLYPSICDKQGKNYTVIAWLWARTVSSPNPLAHGAHVPLVSSLMLSKKNGSKVWVEIVEDTSATDGWRFEVKTGEISKQQEERLSKGTKSGKAQDFVCCLTHSPIQRDYIQAEGKAGKLSKRLMAIVALGPNGRVYFSPDKEHELLAMSVEKNHEAQEAKDTFLNGSTPTRAMVTGGVCSAYGLQTWGDLFTGRQLKALISFSKLIEDIRVEIEKDAIAAGFKNDHIPFDEGGNGALSYSQAVCVYLAFAIDKMADLSNSLNRWEPNAQCPRQLFARQAIPMIFDFAESNVFGDSSGSWDVHINNIVKCILSDSFDFPRDKAGYAEQRDAQSSCGATGFIISMDPPYYDNIDYSDLSDFFYVWLRHSIHNMFPSLFRTMLVPKAEELIAAPFRHGGNAGKAKAFFEQGMQVACKNVYDYARDDIPVTVYYAYKQTDNDTTSGELSSSGWETMLTALMNAGFMVNGTWPVRTECSSRAVSQGTNALASSVILVCRKRPKSAPVCTRRNFINELKRELRPALQKLQSSNIAPVDLAQSAIGPGIGVYSKYSQVLEADGTPMAVRSALQIINQEIDLFFNEQDSDLDSESRFCVDLYSMLAFNEINFGDANTLANAKGTAVAIIASHGTLFAQKGKVHLIERAELPANINTSEPCIWLLCQQLTYRMEKKGIEGCAKAVAEMYGSNAERAKDLAYRLYTIAERKKWAQEGYAYNALVVAWPEIQSRAAELRAVVPQQMTLDDIITK